MKIPIAKPDLEEQEMKAAAEVIRSGWITQGPKVKEFEEAFASHIGSAYACATSSCTAALHLALLTVGVKPNDVVITVSHSFISTANAVRYCGGEPVFVDIDLETYNLSPEALARFLKEECRKEGDELKHQDNRVAAILVVHQMGMPANLPSLLSLADQFNLPVIEDAACAIGSEISFDIGENWDRIGKPHGTIACFSFHPRKVLTTGEGGMLTTSQGDYDQYFRLLRHQGMSVSDLARHQSKSIVFEEYVEMGFNYRLTDIQAAIGIEQLKRIDSMIKNRRDLAHIYREGLAEVSWVSLPEEPRYAKSNWQSFPVRVLEGAPRSRDELMQYLLDKDISTRPGIMNAHQEKIYNQRSFSLPNSELARDTVVLLPLYNAMSQDEINQVIKAVKNV